MLIKYGMFEDSKHVHICLQQNAQIRCFICIGAGTNHLLTKALVLS